MTTDRLRQLSADLEALYNEGSDDVLTREEKERKKALRTELAMARCMVRSLAGTADLYEGRVQAIDRQVQELLAERERLVNRLACTLQCVTMEADIRGRLDSIKAGG